MLEEIAKLSTFFGVSKTTAAVVFLAVTVWVLVWKGMALWKAARKKHPYWFIALLVVNTMGIFEIIYIFLIDKLLDKKEQNKGAEGSNVQ